MSVFQWRGVTYRIMSQARKQRQKRVRHNDDTLLIDTLIALHRFTVDNGYAPKPVELAEYMGITMDSMSNRFYRLRHRHGVRFRVNKIGGYVLDGIEDNEAD